MPCPALPCDAPPAVQEAYLSEYGCIPSRQISHNHMRSGIFRYVVLGQSFTLTFSALAVLHRVTAEGTWAFLEQLVQVHSA